MDKFIGKWAFPANDSLLEQSARRGPQNDFARIADDIIEKMQFEKNDVVLDLCCGNAALARYVANTCKEIHGIDHSKELLSAAKKLKGQNDISNLRLRLADALKIDELYKENFFDKSYCYFSFQYFSRRKREALLRKLSHVTQRKGWIFLGDVPDRMRMWSFYETRWKFYREKLSRLAQFKPGECDLGWWVDPREILDWCGRNRLSASIMPQDKSLPHAHYRFDVSIRNSK